MAVKNIGRILEGVGMLTAQKHPIEGNVAVLLWTCVEEAVLHQRRDDCREGEEQPRDVPPPSLRRPR